jgi:three-Cys-motif partner protein
MGDLVAGDDGLLAEDVAAHTKQKHQYLERYLDISSGARKGFLEGSGRTDFIGGASYIDLFCGVGRCKVRDSGEYIDGGAITAWKISRASRTPFSMLYIADADDDRRGIMAERLRRLEAPVTELPGTALDAAKQLPKLLAKDGLKHGLHFAFLDPYNLGALDFRILESLGSMKRMDMLIHVSAMDLQRNIAGQLGSSEATDWDNFAPGWRTHVLKEAPQRAQRLAMMEYWRSLVAGLGMHPGRDGEVRLITGSQNQNLYWLLIAARHELAMKFWKIASNPEQQQELDF